MADDVNNNITSTMERVERKIPYKKRLPRTITDTVNTFDGSYGITSGKNVVEMISGVWDKGETSKHHGLEELERHMRGYTLIGPHQLDHNPITPTTRRRGRPRKTTIKAFLVQGPILNEGKGDLHEEDEAAKLDRWGSW